MFRVTLLILLFVAVTIPYAPPRSPLTAISRDYVIRTDRVDYLAKFERTIDKYPIYGFTVITEFPNCTPVPIYLEGCRPDILYPIYSVGLVGATEGKYSAYNPAWACVGGVVKVVQPWETRVERLHLQGPSGWSQKDGIGGQVFEGQLYIDYSGYRSNLFTVKLQPPVEREKHRDPK
ncbi:MAG TPA: hypothetical protein VJ302_28855 [Blastocatellia bacterium]|nr:hypothetical protein [Blastocatellia bacterium]